jgi:hypothetical protein
MYFSGDIFTSLPLQKGSERTTEKEKKLSIGWGVSLYKNASRISGKCGNQQKNVQLFSRIN